MKNYLRSALALAALTAASTLAHAVYAPLPAQDLGKAFTYHLGASVYNDSNIFGSAKGAISSAVYNLSFGLGFNSSVTDQTFLSLGYDLSRDNVVDRPGKKNLTNHAFTSRLSHTFSEATTLDISENYQITGRPDSLLNGVTTLTGDQSAKNNQFNLRFQTTAGEKGTVAFKYRNMDINYDTETLARSLDRNDHLFGLEAAFALLPDVKLVGEYRYGQVNYKTDNTPAVAATATHPAFVAQFAKDKKSNYLMAGVNYLPSEKTIFTARGGFENRSRDFTGSTSAPYVELSAKHAYAEGSSFTATYTYSLEESTDVLRFTDSKVSRFAATVQHHLSPMVIASSSFIYESAELQGRVGQRNLAESATRFGVALIWQPTKNWDVGATLDVDHTTSDDVNRTQERTRYGLGARFSF